MKTAVAIILALATFWNVATALTAAQWRPQSIYQVLTDRFARADGSTTAPCDATGGIYCGGSWQGIINKIDYIQGMGFTAIWISPVVYNVIGNTPDGSGYHGYWAQKINQLNANFGTESDLKDLSAALHARGMYLMVDVVTNHMGYIANGNTNVDYSIYDVFNNADEYHPYVSCSGISTEPALETCWQGDTIVMLPDVKTEDSNVRVHWNTWISGLVNNYSIDGLRIDSCTEVEPSFFPGFQAAAGGIHILGEVYNGDASQACAYQADMSGFLNYPVYFQLFNAFTSTTGSIKNLVSMINAVKDSCTDTSVLGTFVENHDQPRVPSLTGDYSLDMNAISYTFFADGIPITYQGQEQHYSGGGNSADREAVWLSGFDTSSFFYKFIAALNAFRTYAISKDTSYITSSADVVYSDTSTLVFRKGTTGNQVVSVLSNLGASGSSFTLTLTAAETGYTDNLALTEVLSCTNATTDSSGSLAVPMAGGLPRVYYPTSLIAGFTCKAVTTSAPTTTATVPITFVSKHATAYGDTIYLTGSTASLSSWSTTSAVQLSAANYSSSNPIWFGTVGLEPGTSVSWKFFNRLANGSILWEADPNNVYKVPSKAAQLVVAW